METEEREREWEDSSSHEQDALVFFCFFVCTNSSVRLFIFKCVYVRQVFSVLIYIFIKLEKEIMILRYDFGLVSFFVCFISCLII